MLGIPWIKANELIIDFRDDTITLGPTPNFERRLQDDLITAGYVAYPMRFDPTLKRYSVAMTIGSVTRRMTVSTVGSLTIDTEFAKAAGVALGQVAGSYGGPTGSQGKFFKTASPVIIRNGDWTSKPFPNAEIEDTYAYMKKPRPADPTTANGGELGADFLISNKAVIDFGNSLLCLKK